MPSCRYRALALSFLALISSTGCSSSSTKTGTTPPAKDGGPGKDSGPGVMETCNGAAVLPPIVNVTNAATGAQICNATFVAVDDAGVPEGNDLGSSCSTRFLGCPTDAPAGGSLSCVYALVGVEGAETVEVSAVGFSSVKVNVTSGLDGCSGSSPASDDSVSLESEAQPADAGAPGPPGGTVPAGDVFPDGVIVGGTCAGDVYVPGSVGYLFCDDGVWAYSADDPAPDGFTELPGSGDAG